MKKLTTYLMIVLLSLTFIPTPSHAGATTPATSIPAAKADSAPEARVLIARLDEIKAMDKSKLSSAEKKALRKEVRATKEQLKNSGGGVYLSVGAVIIILLLLIILL